MYAYASLIAQRAPGLLACRGRTRAAPSTRLHDASLRDRIDLGGRIHQVGH